VVSAQNRRFDPRHFKNSSVSDKFFDQWSACSEQSESLSGHRHQKYGIPLGIPYFLLPSDERVDIALIFFALQRVFCCILPRRVL